MMLHTYRFYIPGMECDACALTIEGVIRQQVEHPFESIDFDPEERTIIVQCQQLSADQALETFNCLIEDSGFECTRALSKYHHWMMAGLGCMGGAAVLALSALFPVMPFLWQLILASVSTLLTIVIGKNYLKQAYVAAKQGKSTMDTLFALSAVTSILVSSLGLFLPGFPVMFDVALMVFGFRHLGVGIKDSLKQHYKWHQGFQARVAKQVKLQDGTVKEIKELVPGDVIVLHCHETLPIDGTSLGRCFMEETSLTGETIQASTIEVNEFILAGHRLINAPEGSVAIRVERPFHESHLVISDQLIQAGRLKKNQLQTKTRHSLDYFSPLIIFLSGLSGLVCCASFNLFCGLRCALSVLSSACPCTFGTVIPWTLRGGIKKALPFHVLFKHPDAIDKAAGVNCVVWDLNGTLNEGIPTDIEIHALHFDKRHLLKRMNLVERPLLNNASRNLIAEAICREYDAVAREDDGDSVNEEASAKRIVHEGGVAATVDGEDYCLGNESKLSRLGISLPAALTHTALGLDYDQQILYFVQVKTQQILGYVVYRNRVRDDAKNLIATLKHKFGLRVCLGTGTDAATAHRYAQYLDIEPANVFADLSPGKTTSQHQQDITTKQSLIDYLQDDQKLQVAMIGDAENDAIAVASSHFGIAIHSPSSAIETRDGAEAVIHSKKLTPLSVLFEVAQQTQRTKEQNLTFNLTYNVVVLIFASGLLMPWGIVLPPCLGVPLMTIQSVLTLLNVYALQQSALPKSESLIQHMRTADNGFDDQSIDESCFESTYQHLMRLCLGRVSKQKTIEEKLLEKDQINILPLPMQLISSRNDLDSMARVASSRP